MLDMKKGLILALGLWSHAHYSDVTCYLDASVINFSIIAPVS